MKDKFRVGVIGGGSVAQILYLPVLSAGEDEQLVGYMANHLENEKCAQSRYAL